jgi:hypothetical protein
MAGPNGWRKRISGTITDRQRLDIPSRTPRKCVLIRQDSDRIVRKACDGRGHEIIREIPAKVPAVTQRLRTERSMFVYHGDADAEVASVMSYRGV